jgi:hypothetical protein
MGAAKIVKSALTYDCPYKIYSVFNAAFEIGEFIATAGGSSAAGLLEGTKAQEV